ncbi:MAG: hypothetical protein NWS68_06250 [Erythrobacter sp.]|nr:hypothetical protein [Erythrobacter sp.]
MNSRAFKGVLAGWLILSTAFWLVAMFYAGVIGLPPVDYPTFFVIYLPWLILIGVMLKSWFAKAVHSDRT